MPNHDDQEVEAIKQAIVKSAKAGSPASQRLAAAMYGIPIAEKREETEEHDFSSEEYIAIAQRLINAQRENFRQGNRNCPVCGRPPLLDAEVRLDSGHDTSETSEMGGMAVPDETTEGLSGLSGDNHSEIPPDRDNMVDSSLLSA